MCIDDFFQVECDVVNRGVIFHKKKMNPDEPEFAPPTEKEQFNKLQCDFCHACRNTQIRYAFTTYGRLQYIKRNKERLLTYGYGHQSLIAEIYPGGYNEFENTITNIYEIVTASKRYYGLQFLQ